MAINMNNRTPNLPPIAVQLYKSYLPTAFDESMSILQKMNKVINHLNDIGDISNDLVDKWNELMEWIVGSGLTEIISAEIDKRIADGTFDELIYRIVGDLTLLETVDKSDMVKAINEVLAIAALNDIEIGDIEELNTDAKDNLVSAINELKVRVDVNLQGPISIGESTGYGTISGLKVRQQTVLAMAVEIGNNIAPNIVHLPNGIRYTLDSIALPVTPSHPTLHRKDIFYVNDMGVISYLEGVQSSNPTAPILPSGGVLLAEVDVTATDTTVNDIDITDKRQIKSLSHLLTNNKSNLVQAINEVIESLNDVINDAIGDVANLPTEDKSNIVNAIIEIVNKSATKVDLGNKANLNTDDKSSIVNAINEVIEESATKIDVGNKLNLDTTDKSSIVNAVNEVIATTATNLTDLDVEINQRIDTVVLDTDGKVVEVNQRIDAVVIETDAKIDKVNEDTNVKIDEVNEATNIKIDNVIAETDIKFTETKNIIGDINNLTTDDKTSIVNSINELDLGLGNVGSKLEGVYVNVKSLGAVGDGVADDTNAFLTALATHNIVLVPEGTYVIKQTLTIDENKKLMGVGRTATLKYEGIDCAIILEFFSTLENITILKEYKTAIDRLVTGVRFVSSDATAKDISVRGFHKGLHFIGDGRGSAYNQVFLREAGNNFHAFYFEAMNGGWANENTIYGGRIYVESQWQEAGTFGAYMKGYELNPINNNKFFGTSFEAVSTGVHIEGMYNQFFGVRFEQNVVAKYAHVVIKNYGVRVSTNNGFFGFYGFMRRGTELFFRDKSDVIIDYNGENYFFGRGTPLVAQDSTIQLDEAGYRKWFLKYDTSANKATFEANGVAKFSVTNDGTDFHGLVANNLRGPYVTSSTRPSNPVIGTMYYDTGLKKPLWYNGSAYVDGTGTVV